MSVQEERGPGRNSECTRQALGRLDSVMLPHPRMLLLAVKERQAMQRSAIFAVIVTTFMVVEVNAE